MNFLEHFYIKTLKYDLINKFSYENTKKFPKLKKIILNFGCQTSEIKQIASSLLALELIANQKGKVTNTKQPNILLKIRKGNPVGCKITLRRKKMFCFLSRLLVNLLPKLKNFDGLKSNRKTSNTFSYKLNDTLSFNELEKHYYLFNNLPRLNITLVSNLSEKQELLFILNSLKLPIK